jgi:hypothetical protein
MKKSTLTNKLGWVMTLALIALMLHPGSSYAQLTRGAITGTVRDESGAIIPGAEVRVTNPNTNQSRDTTTNDEGFYRIAALEPGTYVVVVSRTGFGTIENRQVTVQSANETTFDVDLKAGGVTETVDVTAQSEAITLNKTNPTIGLTVTSKQAEELPLGAARNVNNLALLSPNVYTAPGSSGISANGQRARNNNFTIDGSDNNDISVTLPTTPVVPEAVAEFQIQTNPYNVEFGRNSGAQINIITKSGTNEFHGDLFEYYRGSRLNALDNIEKQNGLTRPARFNRNQAGFDIGGPLHLPRFGEGGPSIYSGKDRTFFFYLFQTDRTRSGASPGTAARIPTPAGFAALQNVPLRNGQSAASRQAVLNSISFLTGIYAQNVPFRNLTNTTVNGVAIQTGLVNVPFFPNTDIDNHTLRIDHRLTNKDNLTGRYISNQPVNIGQISNLQFGNLFAGDQAILDQNLALSETHIFSSNVLNEFRFSYIRRNLAFPENDPTTPSTTISGNFSIGGASNFPQGRIQNSFQFSNTLSSLMGRHSLKFGTDIRRIQLYNEAAFDSKGTFTFNNLQDFLNNTAFSFAQALQAATFDARQTQQFYFAQDDFRVNQSLTLNLGLRYEYASVPFGFFGATDAQSLATGVPGPTRPDRNNFAPAFGFAYSPHPEEGSFARKLFGDGTSVIRGGYRINYDMLFFNILTVTASNYPRVVVGQISNATDVYPNLAPVSGAAVFNPLATYANTPEDARTPYSQLYSLSMQREIANDYVVEFGYTGSRSLNQINQLQGNPAFLTPQDIANVIRFGNVAGNTAANAPANERVLSTQLRRANPNVGQRVLIATTAQATYNAGFVSLNKRFSRGLQFGLSYTRGKLMSNNDESLGVGAITNFSPQVPQDYLNVAPEKSLSAFDRKHRFVGHFDYEVPLPPGEMFQRGVLKQIFGGLLFSGIVTRQSGQPFTILTGVDSNGNGAGGDRPNVNPDAPIIPDPVTGNLRTFTAPGRFIVPRGANGLPLANSLGNGNLGRNTLRGPGFYNTDLSVQKKFYIGRGEDPDQLILRADFLNAFNQDNYGIPVNSLNSVDFGRNLNNFGNRSITLGLKYKF